MGWGEGGRRRRRGEGSHGPSRTGVEEDCKREAGGDGERSTCNSTGSAPSSSNISTGFAASPAARMCAVFSSSACQRGQTGGLGLKHGGAQQIQGEAAGRQDLRLFELRLGKRLEF
jgi:hypothetical protein